MSPIQGNFSPGRLIGRARHILASAAELESEELAKVAAESGATLIGDAELRERVTLRGTLTSLTINPPGDNRWFEGLLSDGTGSVRLVWMGRRTIAGLHAGQTLRVSGMLTDAGEGPVVYNPEYKVIP